MRKTLAAIIVLLSLAPLAANAYGNRNWLYQNQFFNENISNNSYSWGYNYRARGRHTTIRLEEDRSGWMHNGNVRNSTADGTYHWDKVENPK